MAAKAAAKGESRKDPAPGGGVPPDWTKVAQTLFLSRALDDIEEKELLPGREMFYQFSARGHDLAQIILAQHLTNPYDCFTGYYRSRPILLGVGVDLDEAVDCAL